jgi:hypothetical protein
MNISRDKLQKIILEEYAIEEGFVLTEDKVDDILAWVRGGKRPAWADEDERIPPAPPKVPTGPSPDFRAAETMPMDIPSDDATERDYSGFQDRSGPSDGPLAEPEDMSDEDIISSIGRMIQGKDPETVQALFQTAFEQIPGVEMATRPPEEEDTPPESLYVHGPATGAPIGFREDLASEVYKRLLEMGGTMYRGMGAAYKRDDDEEVDEGHYHDMGSEDEMYDALDPHGFGKMSDAQIVDQAWKDGIEEMIVLDGEGYLANREEVLAAMKDV